MPYSKIAQYCITIEGLPSVSLKHPSSYGKDTLKEVLSRRGQLKIQGAYTYGKQKHLRCKKVAWPRKTATKRGDMRVWPR